MPVLTSESVLAELRRLPLLTPEQVARLESAAGRAAPTPERIISRLVEKRWLTPFQAEALLAGKGAGLVFGKYVLLARLGEGGMGAVFKARHLRLGRIDALKVIRADKIASKLVAKRFLREIQLTADLNHPHLIKALDAGQVGAQLYLATEFVAGEDLTATVRREGCLSVADACLVIYQTALALRHIHERGLIHRDLKPSNIMREEKTHTVKVLDLGLSNSLNDLPDLGSFAGNLTRDGVMLGTPDFMPPEQARNPHGVDIRADLYSLGCTFYYLLTGRTPYEGSAVEKLMKHTTSDVPPLILPHGPTPLALAAIVSKLMAKRPEDRFQTPQELIDVMLALRPGQPAIAAGAFALEPKATEKADWQSQFDLLIANDPSSSGANPVPLDPIPTASRSRKYWWIAAAGVLLAATLAFALRSRDRTPEELPAPDNSFVEEDPADELKQLQKLVKTGGENREQLRARVLEYRAKNSSDPYALAAASLLRKLPSPLDRLAPVKHGCSETPLVRLGEADGNVVGLQFSAADDRLLVVRESHPPQEWELPAGKETDRFASLTVPQEAAPSVTPNGRIALLVDGDGALVVWSEGVARTVALEQDRKAAVAALLPDGKSAVVALADSEDRVVHVMLDSGRIAGRLDHPSEGVTRLIISPDGASCLVFGPERMVRMLSIATGKLLQAFDAPTSTAVDPFGIFGPDGQRVYLIGVHRTAAQYAPGSTAPESTYEVAEGKPNPFFPRMKRDGQPTAIAVAADETTTAVGTHSGHLHLYSTSSGRMTQGYRFREPIRALAFSTHGRVLAIALDDGSVFLLPLKA